MKVLWEKSPMTTTQIIQALSEESDWKPKTIHTLINRLVNKEALSVDKNSGQYKFYPLITREECIKEETGTYIRKFFQGSLYNMVANFISNDQITQKEIEELKKLLNEKIET